MNSDRSRYNEVVLSRSALEGFIKRGIADSNISAGLADRIREVGRTADKVAANCSWQPAAECGCPAYIAYYGDDDSAYRNPFFAMSGKLYDFGIRFDKAVMAETGLGEDDIVIRVVD